MDLGKINIVEEKLEDFGFRKQAPQQEPKAETDTEQQATNPVVILNLEED